MDPKKFFKVPWKGLCTGPQKMSELWSQSGGDSEQWFLKFPNGHGRMEKIFDPHQQFSRSHVVKHFHGSTAIV